MVFLSTVVWIGFISAVGYVFRKDISRLVKAIIAKLEATKDDDKPNYLG